LDVVCKVLGEEADFQGREHGTALLIAMEGEEELGVDAVEAFVHALGTQVAADDAEPQTQVVGVRPLLQLPRYMLAHLVDLSIVDGRTEPCEDVD
jgi:hypothetical protein